jgi:hypothetical protein
MLFVAIGLTLALIASDVLDLANAASLKAP